MFTAYSFYFDIASINAPIINSSFFFGFKKDNIFKILFFEYLIINLFFYFDLN